MGIPSLIVAEGLFSAETLARENDLGLAELSHALLTTPEAVRAATRGADAIVVTVQPLPAELVGALGDGVRIIGRAGIGLDAIDLEAAKGRGIAVFHTPDYCTDEVASHALAMILSLHRRLPQSDLVARHDWTAWQSVGRIPALSDLTVGIVGYGRIGRALARLLAPFKVAIVCYDPWVTSTEDSTSAVGSLEELLDVADIVSLHSPLTPETSGLISESMLRRMRPGAYLINVSRGGLVDEVALASALSDGRLGGAALDVLPTEPPARDSPLLSSPNTLLSPHTAWYSAASEARVWRETIDGVLAYLHGETPTTGRLAVIP